MYHHRAMHEGRKRALLIAAAILVARHLPGLDIRRTPLTESLIADAIRVASRILDRIDAIYPSPRGAGQ